MSRRALVVTGLSRLWKVLTRRDRNLLRRFRRAAPLILVFVGLTLVLDRVGWLGSVETYALDAFVLLREPLESPTVVIVGITEADYLKLFGGRSPLDVSQLQSLIDAIAKGHPSVIGVDLDTSDENFSQLQPGGSAPVIVWARDGEVVARTDNLLPHLFPFLFKSENESFVITTLPGREGQRVLSGLALLPGDNDSTIRRFRREFPTVTGGIADSFSWAIVKAYATTTGQTTAPANESEEGWVMNYSTHPNSFRPLSASEVLYNHSKGKGWEGDLGPVKGKIVLLGGMYRASRDQHETPTGPKYGVELLAHVTESELQGRTFKPPNKYLIWTGELFAGFALVVIHSSFRKRPRSFRYSIVALPVIAALASFLAFSSFALWAFFLPILLAVLIQQLHSDVQDYRTRAVEGLYQEGQTLGQDLRKILPGLRGRVGYTPSVAKSEAVAESETRRQRSLKKARKSSKRVSGKRSADRYKSKRGWRKN